MASSTDLGFKEAREARGQLEAGNIIPVMEYLKSKWPVDRGVRVVAEVGNEEQEWSYVARRGNNQVEMPVKGWRNIFASTGLASFKTLDGLEVRAVMVDGGRDHVGNWEGVKIIAGVYGLDGKSLTKDKPFILEDDMSYEKGYNGRKIGRVSKGAFDKLEEMVMNLKIKEKPAEKVLEV